ncbi:MAG: sugar transferase [Candidatus Dojkabacteria bacterium]|jgi:lipopolysaccharide/colanic/teichoic acid biosynthesis glycosyltransferase
MSKMLYSKIKRAFDILFSLVLLIMLLPLFLVISLLIWLIDKEAVFVKEPLRLGKGQKAFRMYKFRTMIPNAHKEILENEEYAELKKKWIEGGNKLRIDEDIRITKIGKFLRKTDLDELPQIVNVLKGEMSLVGPRPTYKDELSRHLEEYPDDKRYLKNIFSVRPGITGIWQVSGRNEIKFSDRLSMDSIYSMEYNFFLDLKILLKTPYIVLTRKGAYG